MKLGVICDEVSRDFTTAVQFAKEIGLDAIELRMIGHRNILELSWSELATIRAQVKDAHLEVSALATPLFKCRLPSERQVLASSDPFQPQWQNWSDHLKALTHAIQVAEYFETRLIRCFAFYRTERHFAAVRDEIIHLLTKAELLIKRSDAALKLCIENEGSTYMNNAAEIRQIFDALPGRFRLLWDPGNVYDSTTDPLNQYELIRDLVSHIHIKDPVLISGTKRFVPVGKGEIDYADHIRVWREDGYQGYLILEPHLIIGKSSVNGTKESAEYLMRLLAAFDDSGGQYTNIEDIG